MVGELIYLVGVPDRDGKYRGAAKCGGQRYHMTEEEANSTAEELSRITLSQYKVFPMVLTPYVEPKDRPNFWPYNCKD